MYQYRGAGLENVYLKNGYNEVDYGDELAVSIEDAAGLHRAIATSLVNKPTDLSGKEFRFLRIEMDMAQHTLAGILKVGEQSIRQWENGKTKKIPGSAERLMRIYASERLLNQDGKIAIMLEELAALDHHAMTQMCFEETQDGWAEAA
jgi:putative transcriptional regulator